MVFSPRAEGMGQGMGERAVEWPEPLPVGTASTHTVGWSRHESRYYAVIR